MLENSRSYSPYNLTLRPCTSGKIAVTCTHLANFCSDQDLRHRLAAFDDKDDALQIRHCIEHNWSFRRIIGLLSFSCASRNFLPKHCSLNRRSATIQPCRRTRLWLDRSCGGGNWLPRETRQGVLSIFGAMASTTTDKKKVHQNYDLWCIRH